MGNNKGIISKWPDRVWLDRAFPRTQGTFNFKSEIQNITIKNLGTNKTGPRIKFRFAVWLESADPPSIQSSQRSTQRDAGPTYVGKPTQVPFLGPYRIRYNEDDFPRLALFVRWKLRFQPADR